MQTSIDFDAVLSELRESLRLRMGIALVVLTLLIWFTLVLGDVRNERQQDLDFAQSELADVRSIEEQSFWEDQLNLRNTTAKQVGLKIWQDQSPSLLAGSLQSKLCSIAGETGIMSPEIRTSSHERVFRDSRLFRLKASVRGYYRGTAGVAFIEEIETHSPAILIESISIKTTPRKTVNNRIDLIVIVYFEMDDTP